MALKARNQTKLITASAGGTLVADADESFLIKDVFCKPSSSDTFLTLLIQGTTVGKVRVAGLAGSHLPYPCLKTAQIYEHLRGTILAQLRAAGLAMLGLPARAGNGDIEGYKANRLDIRFPVASGETFRVSRYAETGNVCLLYDVYDAGDVTPDLPNGRLSKVQRYLHYGTNAASAADGDCAVATSLIWTGGDDWPFGGGAVAEKNIMRLLAIVGCPLGKGASTTNKGYTTHLKLTHRNTILFDEDRSGLPFRGDSSGISAASYVSEGSVVGVGTGLNPTPPLILDPALEFAEGERLTTAIVIAGYASGGPGAAELDLAYVLEHEYLAG
jgi:hypothetical protein